MSAKDIDIIVDDIVSCIKPEWNKDEKIRFVYIALGKLISKNVNFFYSLGKKLDELTYSFDELRSIYEAETIESPSLICKSSALLLQRIYDKIGIESKLMTTTSFNHFENGTDALDIYHWFLCVTGEKDRNYFLTIIPDLYFIQFNMKTKHFANRIDYLRDSGDGPKPVYQGKEVKVHAMSDEELEEIDKKIGYLKSYVEKEDGTLVTEYDNIFVDYLRKYIRTNQYVVDLGYEMPFYNEVTTYKVKDDMNIYDYLNNGYRNQDDLDKWFKLLTDKIDERFEDNPAKYRECIGKVNGLKKCIKTNNARKFRVLMGILASDFVPEKWQVDENNYCSTEYLTKKMEFLFPRLFSCNEEFPPLTARFTGLAEQMDFLDMFMEEMFCELYTKGSSTGFKRDEKLSIVRNRINRNVIYNKRTGQYSLIFCIDNKNIYFYFNPNTGRFYKIKNILTLFSKNFIIVSDKLRNRMKEVEDIEITR